MTEKTEYSVTSDKMVLQVGTKLICPTLWKYEAPQFHRDDPETSKRAAEKARKARGLRVAKIMDCLRKHGALIPAQIAKHTGLDYHAIQRLGKVIEEEGLIVRGPDELHDQRYWRAK